MGTSAARALVYAALLSTSIHSDICETILCVGNTVLADIAESGHIFHAGWKQRDSVPKNMDNVPLDTVLIQDCAGPDLGPTKNTHTLLPIIAYIVRVFMLIGVYAKRT